MANKLRKNYFETKVGQLHTSVDENQTPLEAARLD